MPELTRRYVIMALATEAPFDLADPDGAFVLKPWKDPAALRALRAYADHCYPALARDLQAWTRAVEEGPVIRGDVGRRNERHMGERTPARRAPARGRPAKARSGRPSAGRTARPARRKATGKTRRRRS